MESPSDTRQAEVGPASRASLSQTAAGVGVPLPQAGGRIISEPPSGGIGGWTPAVPWWSLAVAVAAIMFSSSGFFARTPWLELWPVEQRGGILGFWRAFFALLILAPLVRRPAWHPGMLIMAAAFAAMNWTYLTALVSGPPANAIWLQNTAPLWVLLIGVLFLGERLQPGDLLMMGLCGAGIGLIVVCQLAWGPPGSSARAVWLALLSGFLYATVVLSLRALRDQDSAWLVFINHLATVILLAPIGLQSNPWPHGWLWLLLAAFGFLQLGLPYWMLARSLRHVPGHEAAAIMLLEPILLPVWVFVAWRHTAGYEPAAWWTWAGASLILLGLLLRFTPRRWGRRAARHASRPD
jgi:drug/metabolite transporter, DME family